MVVIKGIAVIKTISKKKKKNAKAKWLPDK